MTRKLAITTLILTLTIGCNDTAVEDKTTDTIAIASDFDLQTDLLDFSTKMTDLDTLTIFANLSACLSWQEEINKLTKKDGQVFISGSIVGDYIDDQDKELEQVKYNYLPTDTLNFETLFRYMQDKGTEDRQINSQVFTVVYNQDTVKYFSDGLTDPLHNIDYYIQIKRRLYPEAEVYKPVLVPEPELPKPMTENDSILDW